MTHTDEQLWQFAQQEHTIEALQEYLASFPQGAYAQEAAKQLKILTFKKNRVRKVPTPERKINNEQEDWKMVLAADTAEMYRKYLVKYPQGKYKNIAYDYIEAIEAGLRAEKTTTEKEVKSDNLPAVRPSSAVMLVKKSAKRFLILGAFVVFVWWILTEFLF